MLLKNLKNRFMSRFLSIIKLVFLGLIIFYNIGFVVNFALNNQYAVREIKYIENKRQAEGIYEVIEKDYTDIIFYLGIQILLLILILIIDLLLRIRRGSELRASTESLDK
jgi:hypothetical protein